MMKERRRRGKKQEQLEEKTRKRLWKELWDEDEIERATKKTPTNLWLCNFFFFLVSRRVGRSALRVCVRRCLEPNSISFSPLQPWSVAPLCHPYNCTFHTHTRHKQSGDVPELPDTTLGDTQVPDAGLVCAPTPHMAHSHTCRDLLCSAQTSTTTTATRTRSTTTRPTVRARPRSPTTTRRPHHTAPPLRPPRTPQQQGQQRRACPGSC